MTLLRLIGLNSVILVGFFVFGTRVILVLFISAIDSFELRTFSTMHITSLPTIIQYYI